MTKKSVPSSHQLVPSWSLVRPSVELVQQNAEQILFLFLLPALLLDWGLLLVNGLQPATHLVDISSKQRLGLAVIGLAVIWAFINMAPSVYFLAKAKRGKAPQLGECYRRGLPLLLRVIGVNILAGVAIICTLFVLLPRFLLAQYYLVDKELGVREALRRSWRQSQPFYWNIWGILGVQAVFALLASAASGVPLVGVIASALIGYICLFLPALRYHEIQAATHAKPHAGKNTK